MKDRRAKNGGQDAGTEVSGVGHERVTVMDSPLAVEPHGDGANRQRARAEARASFARVGARTEPERLFETGGLRWRFPRSSNPCEAAIVNTGGGVAGGDSYSVSLTLERRRRSRGDHAFGGTDLSQRRPGGRDRDPAHAYAAARGSSGCLRRRCSSKARGLSGGSKSRRRARLSSLLRKRWCSGASRWAKPGSTRA